MRKPRLRDNKQTFSEIYPLNDIPDEIIVKIGGGIVYQLYIGSRDLTGSMWGDIFAKAIGGIHLDSPLGIADVILNKSAWSMKTVKNRNPFDATNLRIISGRCSPDYSYGITDPHKNIQETGTAVLGIWNERINIARDAYNPVRSSILVRSSDLLSFCIFEEEVNRYRTSDFIWEVNQNGNLIGKNRETGQIFFTWQPHGSQFTIHTTIPQTAIKFTLQQPPVLKQEEILEFLHYDRSWINITR